jgi:hypothetical protein
MRNLSYLIMLDLLFVVIISGCSSGSQVPTESPADLPDTQEATSRPLDTGDPVVKATTTNEPVGIK